MSDSIDRGPSSQKRMCREVKEPCDRCERDIEEIGGLSLFAGTMICKDCFLDLLDWLDLGGCGD